MKKQVVLLCVVCFILGLAVSVCMGAFGREKEPCASSGKPEEKIITGYGYIRGTSRTTLSNKYGAYVSKVHIYSDKPVKKGDCILEYDDFDLRKKIVAQKVDIANAERALAEALTDLELVRLDPLPSEYRNIHWKIKRARELLVKTENEWRTFDRLFKHKSVSELDLRSKKQEYQDALASYESVVHDQERINRGLRKLKIRQAEENVKAARTRLEGLRKNLAVLEEEKKFYKIVTPYDGVIVTNSDTVHLWDNAGTAAAVIHKVVRGYYIYSYFEEKDLIHIPDGTIARFFSNDSGKWYEARSFEVTRSRTAVGDKVFHLVKFKVLSPIDKKVTLDSNVILQIKVR